LGDQLVLLERVLHRLDPEPLAGEDLARARVDVFEEEDPDFVLREGGSRRGCHRARILSMTTERYLVLSALGPDRPGLVAEVTHYVTERGGNIEDSRMAVFGGEFGVMMLISGSADEIARVAREHGELRQATGLDVTTRDTKSPEEHRRAQSIPCVIT